MKPLKFIVADTEVFFRKGVSSFLSMYYQNCKIEECENPEDLLNALAESETLPTVTIIGKLLGAIDETIHIKEIIEVFPSVRVLVLGSLSPTTILTDLLSIGIHGYLSKSTSIDEFHKAIEALLANRTFFNSQIASLMHNELIEDPGQEVVINIPKLKPLELEVLKLVCQEYTAHEIATLISLSPRTVEGYRRRLLEKTGCKNTAGLIIYAIVHKLVDVEELMGQPEMQQA